MIRICPICKKEINHKNPISFKKSQQLNKPCMSCSSSERANRPEEIKKNRERNLGRQTWLNKKHTEKSKNKIRNSLIGRFSGEKNSMYGKTYYDIWLKKYGKEIADTKLKELKEKKSLKMMGNLNPMYNKPSPIGSGNGWSGWYKNWYFRSILELSFMVKVIERFNLNWESGELKKYKIEYFGDGNKIKNYFSDFIINKKYVVECKPKKLWKSRNVMNKKNGAIIFCEKNDYIYKIMDIGKLSDLEIFNLHKNKEIKFIEKYEKKYNERYNNN